jgi:Fe2+ or Zn2+ uptake regulation protein
MSEPRPVSEHAARDLFRRHGLRCTKQRQVIYAALTATKAHPTAEELLGMVRTGEPGLSLATVYNTLEALTKVGLARRLPSHSGNGPCRYDADVRQHIHITTTDGRVLDVPEDLADRLPEPVPADLRRELEHRLGVRITQVHVELRGESASPDRN